MCFFTDRSKIRLDEKDIECFKIVRKGKKYCFIKLIEE